MKRIRQKSLLMITFVLILIPSILIITQVSVHGVFLLNPDNEPKISNVLVTDISETSATIKWDTDKNSNSTVNYGSSSDLGDAESDSSLVKKHSILLNGLTPATTYFFEVQSGTPSGAVTIDNNTGSFYTFETIGSSPPVISNIDITEISEVSATITWDTDKNSDSTVNFGTSTDLDLTEYDPTLVKQHSVSLSGLEPGTTYYFEVESTDSAGNTETDGIYEFTTQTPVTTITTPVTTTTTPVTTTTTPVTTTTPDTTSPGDTTPPEISVVQAKKLSETSEKITWNTNEYSTSTVYFGTTIVLGDSKSNSTLTKRHTMILTDLVPDTTYYFKVESTNIAGNSAIDDNNGAFYTFTMIPAAETTTTSPETITSSPETTTTITTTTTPSVDTPAVLQFVSNDQSTMNGTIEIDTTFSTDMMYVPTGNPSDPIDDAMIRFIDNTDKVYMGWDEHSNGIYRIELTPKTLGDFTIVIEAEKDGFETNTAVLYLNVEPIQTDLYFVSTYQANEIAPFRVNETYTTIIQFNRTSTFPEAPIDNATFTLNLEPYESEIVYMPPTPLGDGKYQLEVTGNLNQSNQVTISIEASKHWKEIANGYESDEVTLVLFTGIMETELRFLSNNQTIETETIQVYDIITTSVQYYATGIAPAVSIPEGSLEIQSSNLEKSNIQISNENGTYFLDISTNTTGQFNLDLKASAGPNYFNASASLTLIVEPIPTKLRIITPETTDNHVRFIYLEPLEIIVRYSDENDQGIEIKQDNYDYKIDKLDLPVFQKEETIGDYKFTFEPSSPGTYQIFLTFDKPNYASQEIQIVIEIDPIPMVNKHEQDIIEVETEQDTKTLAIDLRNMVDDAPIIGANVTYIIAMHPEINGSMEDLGNGTYVVDIPGEKFNGENSYIIEIIAEKANHATLTVEYSLLIQSESILEQYWYFGILGSLVVGGTSSYAFRKSKRHRARTLLEAQKSVVLQYMGDLAHFMDLLVITPSGIPFYSFTESISPKGLDPSLYSSFLLSIKTFADESLQNGQVANEDHFRFGGTEIFLYSIRELIFAFFFSAQLEVEDEWKKVSPKVLQHCRELTIQIEQDFHDVVQEFETYNRANIIPKAKLLEVVTKGLALDLVLPHYIIDMNRHKEIDMIDENLIIHTSEQISSETGVINILQIIEKLNSSDISTDDLLYTFYQLRKESAIVPLDIEESLSVLEESLQDSITPAINLDESLTILEESLQDSDTSPDTLEEYISIFEMSLQELTVLPIVANNPEKILTLLGKLRVILSNESDDENSDF